MPVTAPGTVMREIPFPAAVIWASDIAYDKLSGSFWLLAGTASAAVSTPNVIVQVTAATGAWVKTINANSWPFTIVDGSTMAFDGSSFWITSNGQSGGVNVSSIYQIFSNGIYLNNYYACAATTTGFCQGLAWDSTTASLWSAGSDNPKLVKNEIVNGVLLPSGQSYANLWSGSGVTDVSFDSATGEVFVVKNGVIRVKANSGTALGTIAFTLPGNGRGDWDGQYFWVVDNGAKKIKAVFVR